ncbi:kinase-like domain-containing protein [Rhizophagus irregularis DAOM 181602=DAOM 197198]|nr:kinase-like domain-containing protein [Rhizophagus irregularis DAOM 181602=DAOM 197198]
MSNIRKKLIRAVLIRSFTSIDYNIYVDFHEQYEFPYWIDGKYDEWDSKKQQLIRLGTHAVILKELKNVENASQSWFEEAKSHLTLSNKNSEIVQCFEEEQKALYISRSYDFSLSDNTSNLSKSGKINFKENDSKESSRLFKKLKVENDVQNDHDREIMQQRSDISVNDEVQDNPNLHSEEKDKTPDDGFQINFQLI